MASREGLLIGREKEIAALSAVLATVETQGGQSLLIGAPAGVGKSRLRREAVQAAARRGFVVLAAGCRVAGEGPYAPFARAFEPILPSMPLETSTEALVSLLSDRLGETAARTPILLTIEDLHWAPQETVEVWNQLARAARTLRLVCLGTFRDDETPTESSLWHTLDEGVTQFIGLNAFGPAAVRALTEALLGSVKVGEEFYRWLSHVTDGNAYYLLELLRTMQDQGWLVERAGAWELSVDLDRSELPSDLLATLTRRMMALPAEARTLVQAAAVIGRDFEPAVLRAVSDLDEAAFEAHLQGLLARQAMEREGDRLILPHDTLRRAIYDTTPDPVRRDLHRRCGEGLEGRFEAGAAISPSELALHFERGGSPERAFRWWREAAERADAAGAEAIARDHRAQALALVEELPGDRDALRRELWWEIGSSAFIQSPGTAIPALESLLASETPERRMVLEMLAIAHGFAGQPARGLTYHDAALRLLDSRGTAEHAQLLVARCPALMTSGRYDELLTVARQACRLFAAADPAELSEPQRSAQVGATAVRNAVCFQGIRPDEGVRDEALALAAALGDQDPFTVMLYFGVWAAWTGRQAAARLYIDRTGLKTRRLGAPPYEWVLYLVPYLHVQRGAFEAALLEAEYALAHRHFAQSSFVRWLLEVVMGHAHLRLGAFDRAEASFQAACEAGNQEGMHLVSLQGLLGLGELRLARGSADRAHPHLDEAHRLAALGPARNPLHQAIAARLLGTLALSEGQVDAAATWAAEALAIASSPEQDNLFEQAQGHLLEARIARARDEETDAFELAKAGFAALGNRFWAGRAIALSEA
jgi:tetratricopeptide (TPR) repeat protein